jgi:phosphatidylinositol-3-phosphatase
VVTAADNPAAGSNRVLTSVLSPRLSGKIVDARLNHYSLNRYLTEVLRVPPLERGARAPDMRLAFGL